MRTPGASKAPSLVPHKGPAKDPPALWAWRTPHFMVHEESLRPIFPEESEHLLLAGDGGALPTHPGHPVPSDPSRCRSSEAAQASRTDTRRQGPQMGMVQDSWPTNSILREPAHLGGEKDHIVFSQKPHPISKSHDSDAVSHLSHGSLPLSMSQHTIHSSQGTRHTGIHPST